ncbi:hypothetical protein H0A66_00585 [Alcaligenaceae bacterium]|nr:hypothetical protein [Alcaligenaceae bacterium]
MDEDGNEMPLAGHLIKRPASNTNTNTSYFFNRSRTNLSRRSVLLPK